MADDPLRQRIQEALDASPGPEGEFLVHRIAQDAIGDDWGSLSPGAREKVREAVRDMLRALLEAVPDPEGTKTNPIKIEALPSRWDHPPYDYEETGSTPTTTETSTP